MAEHFHFAEAPPHPALSPWIARYWSFRAGDGAPDVYRVPPDGGTSLLVAAGTPVLLISGPWVEPLVIPLQPPAQFWGVRLQPGAAAEFTNVPPGELRNVTRPLPALFGVPSAPVARVVAGCITMADAVAAWDAAFLPHVPELHTPDAMAAEVAACIILSRGTVRIGELAAQLQVSPRTLLRRFAHATGISPKQFARVVRFRRSAMELIGPDARLSSIAAVGGYTDQPHLHREWADLLGVTPRRLDELVRMTTHDNILP